MGLCAFALLYYLYRTCTATAALVLRLGRADGPNCTRGFLGRSSSVVRLQCAERFFPSLIDKTGATTMAEKQQKLVLMEKIRSEEHTSELQSLRHLVCRLLLA